MKDANNKTNDRYIENIIFPNPPWYNMIGFLYMNIGTVVLNNMLINRLICDTTGANFLLNIF